MIIEAINLMFLIGKEQELELHRRKNYNDERFKGAQSH